jgi:hypothetical protein
MDWINCSIYGTGVQLREDGRTFAVQLCDAAAAKLCVREIRHMRMLGRVYQYDAVLVEQQFVALDRDDEVTLVPNEIQVPHRTSSVAFSAYRSLRPPSQRYIIWGPLVWVCLKKAADYRHSDRKGSTSGV